MSTRNVLHEADIARALTRISHEILESNGGAEDLVILGIPTRGVALAHRIATLIEEFSGCLLYTSPSPRDKRQSRMPSSA